MLCPPPPTPPTPLPSNKQLPLHFAGAEYTREKYRCVEPIMLSSRFAGLSSHPRPQSEAPLFQSMLPATLPSLRTFYASLLIALSLSAIPTVHSTNAAGELFLKDNALKEGVTVLPSGLQYVDPPFPSVPFCNIRAQVQGHRRPRRR
jgi:hypothetical protein